MSRILLVSSNTANEPFSVYPLGMACVASAAVSAGHVVEQFDCLEKGEKAVELLLARISRFKPDLVGISVRNIDNVDSMALEDNWYLEKVKQLVQRIKAHDSAPVVMGGSAFSIMPHRILDYTGADYGIAGEGETALCDLADELIRGEEPARIIYGNDTPITTTGFSAPLYEKGLADFYLSESGMLNYQTKRGCPHQCNYCSYPAIEGSAFRRQEPGFVAENLKRMEKEHGVDTVFFTDSVFNDSSGHCIQVAEEMIRQGCNIRWAAYFRPCSTTEEELALFKAAGLYAMEVGSDAACDTTLRGINKSFSFEDVLAFNDISVRQEIPSAHFFMFGGPNETKQTVIQGLENIDRLTGCAVFAFSGIRILPRTGIREIAVRQGIISETDSLIKPSYYCSPLVDKQEMETLITRAFDKRKDRIFPPEKGQARLKALHLFGFKGLLWDMLVSFAGDRTKKAKGAKHARQI
ncbi:MAG TPA: lipid biosynthesis B12-binding/radical SAM protein [Desulfobacteraceae bacterium]|nr:lipid biosynthesis B12-binding/radical SAM protein [Desulfobacteraceae bacterium]